MQPPEPRQRTGLLDQYLRRLIQQAAPEAPEEELTGQERARLLQMCYLWPVTLFGFFLPWMVYARFRASEEMGQHARHGSALAILWLLWCWVAGFLHGLLGRLSEDWALISLWFGGLSLLLLLALLALGRACYHKALRDEPVEVFWLTHQIERLRGFFNT
jgi:hypothetical protein